MTTARMLRTRRSASRLVSSSIWRTRRAESWRIWSSSSLSRSCLAWEAESPDTRSSARTWRSCASAASCTRCASVSSRRVELGGARVEGLFTRDEALLEAADLLPAVERVVGPPSPGRRSLLGAARGRDAVCEAPAGGGEPGGPLHQQQRRDHQAGREHGRRDHDFHCPVSSLRTPPCRARRDPMLRFQEAADRVRPGGPERGSAWKAALRPPRQMAASAWLFEGSVPGVEARSVGVLARKVVVVAVKTEAAGIALKLVDLLLVSGVRADPVCRCGGS